MATKSKAKESLAVSIKEGSDPDYESYRFYKWIKRQCEHRLEEETDEQVKLGLKAFIAACEGFIERVVSHLALEQEAEEVKNIKAVLDDIMKEHPEWTQVKARDWKGRIIGMGITVRKPEEEPKFTESLDM